MYQMHMCELMLLFSHPNSKQTYIIGLKLVPLLAQPTHWIEISTECSIHCCNPYEFDKYQT